MEKIFDEEVILIGISMKRPAAIEHDPGVNIIVNAQNDTRKIDVPEDDLISNEQVEIEEMDEQDGEVSNLKNVEIPNLRLFASVADTADQ